MKTLLSVNANHHVSGGSDVMYFEHSNLFGARGWDLAFLAMSNTKNHSTPFSKYFSKNIDPVKSSFLEKVADAGRIIYSPEARRCIRRLLDEHPVDVAHIHVIFHHISPSVLFELKRRGIPTVLTAHDFKMICPAFQMRNRSGICEKCKGKRVWNVALNRCIGDDILASVAIAFESAVHQWFNFYGRHVDRIVVPSKFYLEKFVEWGWPSEQLIYQPNIVNPIAIPVEPAVGDYFLYFGRLSPEKGVATFIRAAAKAGVRVKIAGTGPIAAELEALTRATGADVEFVGFRSGRDLWRLVDACRAIVLPSEWYENAPMSAIEANLRGKAIIGSSIGGIPELIEPGETGWLFRSGDANDLADRLSVVAQMNTRDVEAVGKAAEATARLRHSPDVYYDKMIGIYRSIGVAA
jgi:glycosyltransferase involved in cell wall biosynthesis